MQEEAEIRDMLKTIESFSLGLKIALERNNKDDIEKNLRNLRLENVKLYKRAKHINQKEIIERTRKISAQIQEIKKNKDDSSKCTRYIGMIIKLTTMNCGEEKFEEEVYIPGIKSSEEVIARYLGLNKEVRAMLTDYYNRFIGLQLLAYGNEDQRQIALEGVNNNLKEGRLPFTEHVTRERLDNELNLSLRNKDGEFSWEDKECLQELDNLLAFANKQAKAQNLTPKVAKKIYEALIPYLYGRLYRKKNK